MLESLLEFVGNNFFIVIFLVALVSSLVGKGKQAQKKTDAPPVRPGSPMPPFGTGPKESKPGSPWAGSNPQAKPQEEPDWRDEDRLERERLEEERRQQQDLERERLEKEQHLRQLEEERAALEERQRRLKRVSEIRNDSRSLNRGTGSGLAVPQSQSAIGDITDPAPIKPDRENLAQAVIWAEILGSPRSKKPLSRR